MLPLSRASRPVERKLSRELSWALGRRLPTPSLLSAQAWRMVQASLAHRLKCTVRVAIGRRSQGVDDIGFIIAHASELLIEYPGLGSIWRKQLEDWSRSFQTFLTHTGMFLTRAGLAPKPGWIADLQPDLSDLHGRGRCVLRVQFRDGTDWHYKPRNGRREAAWSSLLASINESGCALPFFLPTVLPGARHCWVATVPPVPWRRALEAERFYRRAGGLLYLAHIFRAVDLHAENFVIHGEQPVLIDCETLFHPNTPVPQKTALDEDGIFRTGMLSPLAPSDIPHLDSLSLASGEGGQDLAGCSRDFLARGFLEMHHFLSAGGRGPKFRAAVRALLRVRTRYVYRPTWWYREVLRGSLSPNILQRRPIDRAVYLRSRLDDGLCHPAVVRSEIQQLLRGDMPIFHGPAASARRLLTGRQLSAATASLMQGRRADRRPR